MAIHMSRIDELALLTLDRPEALNALSFGQLHDLNRMLDSIAGSDARALLVTGAGRIRPVRAHSTSSRFRILPLAVSGYSLIAMKYSGMS